MCGIYGFVGQRAPSQIDPGVLGRMGDLIVHRGPDDSGAWHDAYARIGMRRLSIIDVAGGHQPITNEDGSIVVVCNGEIYNFQKLRAALEAAGHRFATHSDTETIVHLYEQYGDDFVRHLEGMFGFALWDSRRRRLLIGRDALGIKPLYYGEVSGELVFASEAKALLALPGFQCRPDMDALSHFLGTGYVGAPRSLFSGVKKLPPGCMLITENGSSRIQQFWQLPAEVDRSVSEQDWIAQVRTELERSVQEQMVSDVPIGAFLSGGIDSSAVVAFMSKRSSQPVRTYSIGFKGSSGAALYNELPYARKVADLFKTDHHEILVMPDVATLLPQLVWHLDEPIADAAFITTYLVSKFARQDVTVILSGVGGDELFGGYRRYLDEHYRARYRLVPKFIRRGLIEPIARRLPSDRHGAIVNELRLIRAFIDSDRLDDAQRYRQYLQIFSEAERAGLLPGAVANVDAYLESAFSSSRSADPLRRLMDVDLATQMPEDLLMLTDKMSMAASLECRVPLLDQQLVQLAARMPGRNKIRGKQLKHVLKQALRGTLPDEILYRKKRGFGAPIGAWFKRELAPLLRHVLSREAVERRGLLNPDAVSNAIAEHAASTADRTDHILGLLVFEIWCRLYVDQTTPAALTEEFRQSMAA